MAQRPHEDELQNPIPKNTVVSAFRDRIRELRRVKAADLRPNPKNWRKHPKVQADALRGVLSEIGQADALLVRELPDGTLMIIDGHLRAETMPDAIVAVLVLDVTEEEADKLLLTIDPLAAMAESDPERMASLLKTAVRLFQDILENRSKSARVRRLCQFEFTRET